MTSPGCDGDLALHGHIVDAGAEGPAERPVLATGVAGREHRTDRHLAPVMA